MVNFPVLYTGRGTSKPLQDTGGSFDDYARKYLGAQQMKLEKRMADEQWLSGMMTDPVQLMSSASTERQGALLEAYNDSLTDKLTKTDDNLTWQDKVEVNNARTSLQRAQMKMKAAEERAIKDYEIVQNDHKGIYDKQAAAERFQTYMKTGEYDASPLEVNPLSPTIYFQGITVKGKEVADRENVAEGSYTIFSATPQEAEQRFWAEVDKDVMGNGRLLKGITKEFEGLSEDKKIPYLDANGDNVISEEERQATGYTDNLQANPIMQWARDKYVPMMIKGDFRKGSQAGSGTTGGYNKKVPVSGTNNRNNEYTPKVQPIGGVVLDSFLNLGQESKTFEPQGVSTVYRLENKEYTENKEGGLVPTGRFSEPERMDINTTLAFEISGYDPQRDWVIIRPKSDDKLEKDETYAVPGEEMDDLLRLQYGIDRQSLMEKYGGQEEKKRKLY